MIHSRSLLFCGAAVFLTGAFCRPAAGADLAERWWGYVKVLADDNMEGRNTGSPGHLRAAKYVAQQFAESGLQPAGTNGFLQPVPFQVVKVDQEKSKAALVRGGHAEPLEWGQDVLLSSRTSVEISAPLVFAGYGLSAAEAGYDDLQGLNVRGKIVVYLQGPGPASVPGNVRSHFASRDERRKALRAAGAVGAVRLLDPDNMDIPWDRIRNNAKSASMLLDDESERSNEITGSVNPASAQKWFAGSGHTYAEMLAMAKSGKPLPHFALPATLQVRTVVENSKVESQNVVAVLPGSDPQLKSEYVVLSAHIDHLGIGSPIKGDAIFNGAMDDASGVASLLEIAKELKDSGQRLKRSLLFVAVTGEEKGLLGSKYFNAHPTVAAGSMIADLNIDMFLPIHAMHVMTVFGLNESTLGDVVRRVAEGKDLKVQDDPYPQRNIFIRSDQYNFILHGVPSVMCMDGSEKGSPEEKIEKEWLTNRYHAPSDDAAQPVDLDAAGRFNQVMKLVMVEVANAESRPQWNGNSFFRRFATSGPSKGGS